MRTPCAAWSPRAFSDHNAGPVKLFTILLAVVVLVAACSGPGSKAATSPSPNSPLTSSPSEQPQISAPPAAASPIPAVGSFGVLVTPISGDTYTVSLIDVDGKVVGRALSSSPTVVTCDVAIPAVLPPPISTSNTRVYYMDAEGVVHFLTPGGDTGRATNLPAGGQRRSMFTVSPNDQRIAVVVSDFTSGGAATRLYVEDLNGGTNHIDIFSETGAYGLWPIGWHGSSLVVAKVPTCARSGGLGCCGPLEFHVVDPATGVRRFTIGGADCIVGGPAMPAGAICETTAVDAKVFDWTGGLHKQMPIGFQRPIFLSPDGQHIAFSDAGTTNLDELRTMSMEVCGWIDETHMFSGGDAQQQPDVGDITAGTIVPVAASGICAGRIPGGL